MKGQKTYLQPVEMVLNAIHDVIALQKGQISLCDTARGLVNCQIVMYAEELEYNFAVIDIGSGCSRVTIELAAEASDDRLIENEFALLDYAMLSNARVDFMEQEAWDMQVSNERKKQALNI